MSSNMPEPVLLPWDRFSNWAHCLCVVTFDLELGQSLELVYPKHVNLHDNEKLNVCYLAFPDSYSGRMGDTQYHFRIRRYALPYRLPNATEDYNRHCPGHLQVHEAYMYGFVYFRQARDKSIRRGYFQKSVVLLTPYPFFKLFSELLSLVAPEYFEHGPPGLEAACHDLDQWPSPTCGQLLLLPLVGQVLQVKLPVRADQQRSAILGATAAIASNHETGSSELETEGETLDEEDDQTKEMTVVAPQLTGSIMTQMTAAIIPRSASNIAPRRRSLHFCTGRGCSTFKVNFSPSPEVITRTLHSVHELNLYTALDRLLPHAQLLWELVLLSEPIVVLAPSPQLTSLVVQALVSSIFPLRFATDYRPYFTIHDTEFKEYTTRTQRPPPVILGVTNPFFSKALQHWPNVVRISEDSSAASSTSNRMESGLGSGLSQVKMLEAPSGVYTRYKPFLTKDKAFMKRLSKGATMGRQPEAQAALLRRFFLELTQSFMIPLERHLASLMPLQRTVSAFKAVPSLRRFSAEEFLTSVEKSGPRLTCGVKGNWSGLYRRFFQSPNFAAWYAQRQLEVSAKLVGLRADLLTRQDMGAWARDRSEVEVVDMVLHLRELARAVTAKHMHASVAPAVAEERARALRKQVEVLTDSLSDDLRGILTQG